MFKVFILERRRTGEDEQMLIVAIINIFPWRIEDNHFHALHATQKRHKQTKHRWEIKKRKLEWMAHQMNSQREWAMMQSQ